MAFISDRILPEQDPNEKKNRKNFFILWRIDAHSYNHLTFVLKTEVNQTCYFDKVVVSTFVANKWQAILPEEYRTSIE